MWFLVESFTGTWLIDSSLASPNHNNSVLSMTIYLLPNCPYAKQVLPHLEIWMLNQGMQDWQLLPPTPFYPSPTLRITYRDYGVNYIGKNEILTLIQ